MVQRKQVKKHPYNIFLFSLLTFRGTGSMI
nr:MAG TPA: hypothetical protein [Caudoviricetes sp.]